MSDLIETFIFSKCYSGEAKLGVIPTNLTVDFDRIKLSPKSQISMMGSLVRYKRKYKNIRKKNYIYLVSLLTLKSTKIFYGLRSK